MDLGQLEVFLTVTREGKFSHAAEKLHRTQSAVSQSIHKLEEDIGELLFIALPATASSLMPGASFRNMPERLLNPRRRCHRSAGRAPARCSAGKLAIAANEFTALYLLPVLAESAAASYDQNHGAASLGSHIPGDVLRHNSESRPHLRS